MDPRKSRRHGTDFGLGRYAESSLAALNSHPRNPSKAISVSASMTTMQDNITTDEDSVSSLFECSAFDFPQPPSIGSPVIRRMRSSPWFSDKHSITEGFSNQGSRKPRRSASVLLDSDFCYSVSSVVTQQSRVRRENLRSGHHDFSNLVDETAGTEGDRLHLSPYLELATDDISLEMVGEALIGLDMNASNLGPQHLFMGNGGPSIEFSQSSDDPGRQFAKPSHLDWSIPSDLLHWSISHRSAPLMLAPTSQQRVSGEDTLQNDGYGGHTLRTKTKPDSSLPSEPQATRYLGRLPHIIRKVASMKSDSRRLDAKCIPLGLTGSRTIPKSRSFRSVSCETRNNASATTMIDVGPHQHNFTNLDCFSSSKHAQDPFSPTLNDSFRTSEDCKKHDIQQVSLPSSGLRSKAAQKKAKSTTLPMALSSPFVHRERPLTKCGSDLPKGMDKSFMDITPNQGTKHERSAAATKRARVRKLIARASNSIIGWGRQFTKKIPPSNSSHYTTSGV